MEVNTHGGDAAEMIDQVDCLMAAATAMIGAAAEEVEDFGGGKRKRGRPPRGTVTELKKVQVPGVKKKVVEEEEGEDVCFLCFDGGSLVLCDRRGCPKAYHPACVKRDEAFFQSKAKWNCGWHICSICQKAAHHMCYTCTYSLCKTCTKDADYLSVRGSKGFCAPCMRTVMLIEDIAPGNKETVQVDFDDKSSWEYLFKMYWMYLKGKLSLTLDELIQAKKPCKEVVPSALKVQRLNVFNSNSDCKSSISDVPPQNLEVSDVKKISPQNLEVSDEKKRTTQNLEVSDLKKRRKKEKLILPKIVGCKSAAKSSGKSSTLSGSTEWATKELLEFVAHMRNGDASLLCQFDVQGLLLEYIKRNNLRDPHRKSQIICDARLMTLFLKPRVGHFEMLKLLEYHFLIKEDNQKEDILGNTVGARNQVEGGGNNESLLKTDQNKKRKNRKKGEERGKQTNLDEFAAIDVHNVKLIYLRRSLMEDLVTASGNFLEKIIGSIVRIRMSTADLKQDMYRLVQVVGTFKATVPYKIGGKTVEVELKILNLNKKELVPIDAISNQEFSEDECRRFRQSIKCGFLKRMTVGQVQEIARALQEVRLNDLLEAEILRLKHLRDRASENGRKKELRECVEKIELLKTPEERQRRLHKIPQVHADPKMDPKCESDDDAGEISKQKQADQVKLRRVGFKKLGRDPISPQNKIKQAKFNLDKRPSSRLGEKVPELKKRKEAGVLKIPTVSPSNASPLSASPPSANNSDTEKLWHYRDPIGKIQGPFCLVQLRKWSTTGYFPPDMMVWSINTDEVESLHLADVLSGNFHKALPLRSSTSLPYQDRFYICEDRHSSTVNPAVVTDGKLNNGSWNCSSATSVHQVTVTNGNIISNGNKLYPTGRENQSDSQHFSGQSSVESWRPSAVNTVPVQNLGIEELPSPTPKASGRDEKASVGIQNSPIPLRMLIDTDEKVDSSIGSSPSTLPNAKDRDEKVQASESKPPGTNWTFSKPTPDCSNEKARLFVQNPHSPSQKNVDENEKVDLTCDFVAPKSKDRDEKAGVCIHNLSSPLPKMVDDVSKIDSPIQNMPKSLLDPSDGSMKVQANKSKSLGTSLTFTCSSAKPKDRDQKGGTIIQNHSSPSSNMVEENKKVDSTSQNLPSFPEGERDRNVKVQPNESMPPGIGLACTFGPPMPSDRDEKAGMSIQNIPSPSSKKVGEDGEIDSTVQNLPISSHVNLNVVANENNPPCTSLTCSSSPLDPSDRDEKAVIDIQNLPSASPKTVDGDGESDPTDQKLPKIPLDPEDENKKVQSSESKSPGTSMICISKIAEASDRDEKARRGNQNLPNPSPEMVDEDVKVDSASCTPNTSEQVEANEKMADEKPLQLSSTPNTWEKVEANVANEKPPELCNGEAVTPASNCDQFAPPSTSNNLCSPSNWSAFDFEPIEFTTLGDDLVSDLLAEVDAMEAHGDVASPIPVMFSEDDFFDFVKNDDVNEPHGVTEFDIFDPSRRSNGEASTSNVLGVDTRHNHDSGSQAEIGPHKQINLDNLECNINPSFGGITQGMTYMGWGSNQSLAQINMNLNENMSFGFMGHERQQ